MPRQLTQPTVIPDARSREYLQKLVRELELRFQTIEATPQTGAAPPSGSYVPYSGATADVDLGLYGLSTDHVSLSTSFVSAVGDPVGTFAWNSTYGTAEVKLNSDVKVQIGQELHFYGKASGAISNGDLVQFVTAQGDHIVFKTAVASEIIDFPQGLIGVATCDIANGAFGYVTWFGSVSDIDTVTPGWSEGDILYFDNTTGGLTTTEPLDGNVKIIVAAVQKEASSAPASNGILLVRPVVIPDATDVFVYIQDTAPTVAAGTKYAWWDTSGGGLTLWIEDGT